MQPQDRLDPTMLTIFLDSTQGSTEESVITIYKKCFLNPYMPVHIRFSIFHMVPYEFL